ncbi:MAG: hypothetical protein ACYS19_10795 [Planctomycetota bacterium]
MNRRGFLKILICAMTLAALPIMASAQAQAAKRPNVLVMLSDDMGWGQVGCQGGAVIPTPNIVKIVETKLYNALS